MTKTADSPPGYFRQVWSPAPQREDCVFTLECVLTIYGRSAPSPYPTDAAMERDAWDRGRHFLAEAFSVACPDGEFGFVPADDVTEITEDEFEHARTCGWMPSDAAFLDSASASMRERCPVRSIEAMSALMPTIRATFHPQAWVNDYALDADPEGAVSWEVTPAYLAELFEKLGEEVLESNTYESDDLRYDPAAPEWVRNWGGPFWVELDEREAAAILAGDAFLAMASDCADQSDEFDDPASMAERYTDRERADWLWDAMASNGMVDGRGGIEYRRVLLGQTDEQLRGVGNESIEGPESRVAEWAAETRQRIVVVKKRREELF